MKRLTQKDEQGNWCLKGVSWEQLHEGQVITKPLRERLYGALWKLMEYEDTGLTPEEIERLKEQHRWIPVEERLEVCSDICDNYCKYRDTVDEDGNCEAMRAGIGCPLDKLN